MARVVAVEVAAVEPIASQGRAQRGLYRIKQRFGEACHR